MTRRFLTVGLNPTIQLTIQIASMVPNGVNRGERSRRDVAGKGANVARVLGQIGETALHLSHSGGQGRAFWLAECARDGIEVVSPEDGGEIRTCVTVAERERPATTEFIEPAAPVSESTVAAVWDAFERCIGECDALLMCGSMAPGYPDDFYLRMMEVARTQGVKIGIDVQGSLLRNAVRLKPDLVKINVREFGDTFTPELKQRFAALESKGLSLLDMDEERERFTAVLARLHRDGIAVVLSQGAAPSVVYDGEAIVGVDTIPLTAVNTIGSGDAMTAGVAARFFRGAPLIEAVEYGHTLAAINASLLKPGTTRE